MTEETKVTTNEDRSSPAHRENTRVIRPAVDVFENGESISLLANLPGVPENGLALEVDSNQLTITGDLDIDMPENMDSLYADVRHTRYQRSFTLSSELDTENIAATLKDGLLSVNIPKRKEVLPRRIEITAG
jgi:HSP20 family molecular chaperone IbpA